MKVSHQRLLMAALVLMVSALALSRPASASQNTWLPDFSQGQHVYVDPRLSNDPQNPVSFSGLEGQLAQEAAAHNLAVYVVAVEQGNESLPTGAVWGPYQNNRLVAKWSASPDFPTGNYLVITWVRYRNNPNHGSVGADGGSQLRAWGINKRVLGDPAGPVITALRQYMPGNPQMAMLAIVKNVNSRIDDVIANQKAAEARARFAAELPGMFLKGVLTMAFIVLIVFLIVRYRRSKAAALAAISSWREKLDNANQLYVKLNEGYLGFLKQQSDWKTRFKGNTLAKYTAAVQDFAEFTLRQQAANERGDAAQSAADHNRFPGVSGFNKAVSLLTADTVTVTGDELPLEVATLFGGVVATSTYEPEKLLEAMSDLFDRTNQALSGIVKALEGAKKNGEEIRALTTDIEGLKPALVASGLKFDPYQGRFEHLTAGQEEFLGILASDPLSAFDNSQKVEEAAESLEKDLQRAMAIKKELGDLEGRIAELDGRLKGFRRQAVAYQYPLAAGETAPAQALYSLTETGANPDSILAEARQHQSQSEALVLEAELDRSDAEKALFLSATSGCEKLLEEIFSAKSTVEQSVPEGRVAFSQMQAAIPGASSALDELKQEFLAGNFQGEPERLTEATHLSGSAGQEFALVKSAYDSQDYLSARDRLEKLAATISGATAGLTHVHETLTELKQLRQHSRDTAQACEKRATELHQKLEAKSFTTSAQTDERYQQLLPTLSEFTSEVGKAVADWRMAAKSADALTQGFTSVDQAVDKEEAAYQEAVKEQATANSWFMDAESYVRDSDTRADAHKQFTEADTELNAACQELKVPKSNWEAIAASLKHASALFEAARAEASNDKQMANAARSAIAGADSRISSVNRSYGQGVLANVGSAESYLASARQALTDRQYEQASQEAGYAESAANQAESAASAQVASILAAIAAQQAAQQSSSYSSCSSGGGSSYSSCSSGGGGSSCSSGGGSSCSGGGGSSCGSGGGGSSCGSGGGSY